MWLCSCDHKVSDRSGGGAAQLACVGLPPPIPHMVFFEDVCFFENEWRVLFSRAFRV